MQNTLINSSTQILNQLKHVLLGLTEHEYSKPLSILSGNTIGKHTRHVLEFFDLLVHSYRNGVICYDTRAHDKSIESDKSIGIKKLDEAIFGISKIEKDKMLIMEANYQEKGQDKINIKTSYYRELAYNLEHAIHHMAIIKIAICQAFPNIDVPENFGIAYSTIRYQETN